MTVAAVFFGEAFGDLWGYVDARDVAQACRLGLESEISGAAAFLVALALAAFGLLLRERGWRVAFCVALAASFYAKNLFTLLVVAPPVAVC